MEITLEYFDGCPNWQRVDQDLLAIIDELALTTEVRYQLVDTPEAAIEHDFRGSPTIRINDVDPFAEKDAPVGLSCRIYRTEDGLTGSPSREQLAEALITADA